jgi:hypothetical protein
MSCREKGKFKSGIHTYKQKKARAREREKNGRAGLFGVYISRIRVSSFLSFLLLFLVVVFVLDIVFLHQILYSA